MVRRKLWKAAAEPRANSTLTLSLTEEVVVQLRTDAAFVAPVAEKLGLAGKPRLRTIEQPIDNDEEDAREFKPTAHWVLRETGPASSWKALWLEPSQRFPTPAAARSLSVSVPIARSWAWTAATSE